MSNQEIRVLIMAGGTGGHVFPALAVAEQLRANGAVVEWLGTVQGIEARLVPNAGIPLNTIDIVGLRGKTVLVWLKMPFLLIRAVWQALGIVKRFSPQVVLGLGGFASGPGALAAKIVGKPLVIHEQNAIAGTTNRWLSKLTSHRMVAFPNSLPNAEWVGNPIRKEIAESSDPTMRYGKGGAKKILILGGSLGARRLNEVLPEALAELSVPEGIVVRHQTGKLSYEATRAAYQATGLNVDVAEFIDDMAAAYQWADLIICRAGALTVSEISAVGVAAIFVPFPYAIDDHQTKNAEWLVQNDAAEIIKESELNVADLVSKLTNLLNNPERLLSLAKNAKHMAKLDASLRVAEKCVEVAHG